MILFTCESIFIFRGLGHGLTLSGLFAGGMQTSHPSSLCQSWIPLPPSGEIKAFKAFRTLRTALAQLSSAYFARLKSEQKAAPLHFPPLLLPAASSQNWLGTRQFGRQRGPNDMSVQLQESRSSWQTEAVYSLTTEVTTGLGSDLSSVAYHLCVLGHIINLSVPLFSPG